jgi:hypothetical protein
MNDYLHAVIDLAFSNGKHANDVHRQGTLNDLIWAAENKRPTNCLDILICLSKALPPDGLATNLEAEMIIGDTVHSQGRTFGIAGTTYTVHYIHMDCGGQVTFAGVKAGIKLWTIAVPKSETDLGSTKAFSGSYSRYDFSNDQGWEIYNIILKPGDLLSVHCPFYFNLSLLIVALN